MKEEQAPPMTEHELKSLRRDPDKHYRYVGLDKDASDAGRMDKHKDMGYKIEGTGRRVALMSCSKDAYESRHKSNVKRSDDNTKSASKMETDRGFEIEKSTIERERITGTSSGD